MELRERSKHKIAELRIDGKLYLRAMRSRGSGPLKGNQPAFIRQQMRLNKEQFAALVACPLTRGDYLRILADLGLLPPEVLKQGLT
jgi:hypothetical protein